MKYKRIIIIICAIVFFISALTSYVNRIVFPRLVKKMAIEQIEKLLKRHVEISSIRFNWVRGFIIDKIKIYDKDSTDTVFAQADQVSFGLLFFPGVKHYRITIPFIHVSSPSAHLIRTDINTWNFSDLLVPSTTSTTDISPSKSTGFEIAWGGITINDGKLLVDDHSEGRHWHEFFNNINLKLTLSYKGINYDFITDIPQENGFIGATVNYQPLTQNTQAQIHLRNINTASYLSLMNIPEVHLDSGMIKDINLNIDYSQNKTSAQGDVIMSDLNITNQDQNFKGDIEIHHLDAHYQNGDITAHGQMNLNNIQTTVPGLSAGGSVQTRVDNFELTPDNLTFIGTLHAQKSYIHLKDRQIQADDVVLNNIKIRKDKDGIQSVGSINTQGLIVQWPDQRLEGDINFKNITMRMKDENDISLEGEIQADHFSTQLNDKQIKSKHFVLEDIQLHLLNQKDITLNTKLSIDEIALSFAKTHLIFGSIQSDHLLFTFSDKIIKTSTTLNCSAGKLVLGNGRTIEGSPQLELTLEIPTEKPQDLIYKGSITLSDADIQGFGPIEYLDNIDLDADFQNDKATINALSINVLDTNVRINGSVENFNNPTLHILAEADDLNLSKIKNLAPVLIKQYGLSFDGSSYVKVQFDGLLSKPLSGKILAVVTVKNASVTSSKLHQRIKNITGIIEATPDSLKWRDTTVSFQGKSYSLAGSLENFKRPNIYASINGPDIRFNTNISKDDDVITIHSLKGKYLKADFDSHGTITLASHQDPTLNIQTHASMLLEDLIKILPDEQKKNLLPLNLQGMIDFTTTINGAGSNWKNYAVNSEISSPDLALAGYHLTDMKISINQNAGQIKNSTFDGIFYGGNVHAVGSLDLLTDSLPYDLALNIDSTDLHLLKMDSPLKMQEINGKFYFTTIVHGTIADFKKNIHATGSLAIRDGYLGEFNIFKGLLSMLNDVLQLGQVMITDVEGNFTIEDQKINSDNLRLKGPTIVLLSKGWVNFDQDCDLHVTVDLSSGVVPTIAHDVLNTLNIHIYDKISNPKFKKKISVPQVINSLLKNLLQ